MKTKEWINGNHMKFESEHKTFNRQVDSISTGNVLGHVQLSGFVRAYDETKCNGNISEKGQLQNYDLDKFICKDFPWKIKDYIRKHAKEESVICYEFRHWRGRQKVVHGYIVTTTDHWLMKVFYIKNHWKSYSILKEAAKYITEE